MLPDPVRDLVTGRGFRFVEVDDWLDGDPGAGVAAPAAQGRSDLRRRRPGCRTNRAASTVSAGLEWMVASATARARRAGTRPAWTCAQSRGRRWRSSRAWPMSFFADTLVMPRTVPSSATQNSATSGVPGPAMGSSCSHPATVKVAAEWMDSGGWRSAHWAASSRTSAAAWSSAALRERIEPSRAVGPMASAPASAPASDTSIMFSIVEKGSDSALGLDTPRSATRPARKGEAARYASLVPRLATPPPRVRRAPQPAPSFSRKKSSTASTPACCRWVVTVEWPLPSSSTRMNASPSSVASVSKRLPTAGSER